MCFARSNLVKRLRVFPKVFIYSFECDRKKLKNSRPRVVVHLT